MRVEFRIGGSGGQGVISAAIILANSAIHNGMYAIQSQSYGPEARGGSSKAEVVISDEFIDYPKAMSPNYVLCLTEASYIAYGLKADKNSVVIVDEDVTVTETEREIIKVPIIKTAKDINPKSANVVAVAFLSGFAGVGTQESLFESLKAQFPKFYDTNVECAKAGFKLAEKLK